MRTIIVICALLLATPAQARTLSQAEYEQLLYNNMSHEAIECAAFFSLIGGAMESSNRPEAAEKFMQMGFLMNQWAITLAEKGGIMREAVDSRLQMAVKDMTKSINHSYANMSILLDSHTEICRAVRDEPEKRMRHWIDTVLKRYGSPQN